MKTSLEVPVTVCVLTSGDHPALAERAIGSILSHIDRGLYRLAAGANGVSNRTGAYLEGLREQGQIDYLITSNTNLGKCPMMRRILSQIDSEFLWWFDDDSYVTSHDALNERLKIAQSASPKEVMWGEQYMCEHRAAFCHDDPVAFVRSASWYCGLTPPFWEPGGKGEFNFGGKASGDGRWIFLLGAGWFCRTAALKLLDWPDPRLSTFGEDVFLGEAIRQRGWKFQHIGMLGVETNTAPRRWSIEEDRARARSLGSQPELIPSA